MVKSATLRSRGGRKRGRQRSRQAMRSLAPFGWFGDVAADPEGEEGRHDSGEEQRSPAPPGEHDGGQDSRHQVAHRPRRLHQPDGLAAVPVGPGFGDQDGTGRPLPAQSDADDGAPENQLRDASGGGGEGGERREGKDGPDQCAGAAITIAEPAEEHAPQRRGHKRGGTERSGGRGREMKLAPYRRERKGVKHHVHGVEHPAQLGGEQGTPLRAVDFPVPGLHGGLDTLSKWSPCAGRKIPLPFLCRKFQFIWGWNAMIPQVTFG